ncbi:hypothetical protein [Rahnella perminowiae]|uniref:hypothetical protein n=1 Tax=Rahnella perminowiae TaxID=2816244 RepID=UPI00300EA63F
MTLDHVWGLKALSKPYDQACIDWAEQLLINGNSSDNVLILASLGLDKSPERNEVDKYFERALQDLRETEPEYFDAIKKYALELCHKAVEGHLSQEETINSLAEIYPCTNYDYGIFSIWTDLLDELYLLENEGEYYSHLELTKANKSVYIEKQLRYFIVLLNSKVPHDFVHLSICEECNKLVKVSWQPKTRISVFRKLLQIFKFLEPQYCTECLVCGSTHIVHLQTVEAREKALKML